MVTARLMMMCTLIMTEPASTYTIAACMHEYVATAIDSDLHDLDPCMH